MGLAFRFRLWQLALLVCTSVLVAWTALPPASAQARAQTAESKLGSLLQYQLLLKSQLRQSPSASLQASLAQAGADADHIDRQAVFVHLAGNPSPQVLSDLRSAGAVLDPSSWVPPSSEHPTGFLLADVSIDDLPGLAALQCVRRLETAEQRALPSTDEAGRAVRADALWARGLGGGGVRIAVLDSGLEWDAAARHSDLPARITAKDYSAWTASSQVLDDDVRNRVIGHGTHVTGIAVASGVASGGRFRGMAPKANLVFLKIGNDVDGAASVSAVIKALVDAAGLYRADIINLSYAGFPDDKYHDGSSEVAQAVDYVSEKGALVFVAAGNEATAGQHYLCEPGPVPAFEEIAVNVPGDLAGDLTFRIVWSDGRGVTEGLSLQLLDPAHQPVPGAPPIADPESPRGTESRFAFWRPSAAWVGGTYYLRLWGQATLTSRVHVYAGTDGVTFVGADPHYTIGTPADAERAIAVGAFVSRTSWTDYNGNAHGPYGVVGEVYPFSSCGPTVDGRPKPDLIAPGCEIISLRDHNAPESWLSDYDWWVIDNDGINDGSGPADYLVLQGTSMAAPVAAGGAALLLESLGSSLTGPMRRAAVRSAMLASADYDIGADPNQVGRGRLNLLAAYERLHGPGPTITSSPTATMTRSSVPTPTLTATRTFVPSATPSAVPTATPTPTATPSVEASPTGTASATGTATPEPGLIIVGTVRLESSGGTGLPGVAIYRRLGSSVDILVASTNALGRFETAFAYVPGDETVTLRAEASGYMILPQQHTWQHYRGRATYVRDFVAYPDTPTPTSTGTPATTQTATPPQESSATPTATGTPTAHPTTAPTATPTLTATATEAVTPSATATIAPSPTSTVTATSTPSPTASPSATVTRTPLPTRPANVRQVAFLPLFHIVKAYAPLPTPTRQPRPDLCEEPNDWLGAACGPLVTDREYVGSMDPDTDSADYYYLDQTLQGAIQVTLRDIPDGANLDLVLYDSTFATIAASMSPGNRSEMVRTGILPAGRYYVGVIRIPWSVNGEYALVARFDGSLASTPTPTATAAAATQTPAPTLFSDDFGNPGSGWGEVRYADFETAYEGGEYLIRVKQPGRLGYRWAPDALVVGDARIDVEARDAGGVGGAYGLLLGMPDGEVYAFLLSPAGWYEVLRYASLGSTPAVVVPWSPSEAVLNNGATNRLTLLRSGSQVTLLINGAQPRDPVAVPLVGGVRIGLAAQSFSAVPTDLRFDNLRAAPYYFADWR